MASASDDSILRGQNRTGWRGAAASPATRKSRGGCVWGGGTIIVVGGGEQAGRGSLNKEHRMPNSNPFDSEIHQNRPDRKGPENRIKEEVYEFYLLF